ncbi:MAG: TonB family protein [Acidobacteria bacterium]|nr:TonB family protein [Acidobacteriota bacterium]
MFPQPMSWSEAREEDSNPLARTDLVEALEQQIAGGFPLGLALDLVLNELVVRAATATRARSAALALKRDDEMVCRAATGDHAPDLGISLNTRDGLSGACLRTHKSQLCLDTETDPRVDAEAARRLGIRSMLIVPVLDSADLVGVLEVFATDSSEFVDTDQNLLEIFAREVTRIRRAALELEQRPKIATVPDITPFVLSSTYTVPNKHAPYEIWTLVLGGLAILLAVAISFLIGSRIGWLGTGGTRGSVAPAPQVAEKSSGPSTTPARQQSAADVTAKPPSDANPGGLVVYQKGKVVFRMDPAAPKKSAASDAGPGAATVGPSGRVWLAPDLAESRLRQRTEPQYPPDALAAHRTGEVVLEVIVAADGSIASTSVLTGDPLLAAAATDAVRNWRYEPYRLQGRPAEFQTDVTLKFSLPD